MADQLEEEPPTYYHGRKWDAPMMDDALPLEHAFWEKVAGAASIQNRLCAGCGEELQADENIHLTPGGQWHTECEIRSVLGDVAHLEGRCSCPVNGTPVADRHTQEELDQSFREQSLAAVQWLVEHGRGRWVDGQ